MENFGYMLQGHNDVDGVSVPTNFHILSLSRSPSLSRVSVRKVAFGELHQKKALDHR